MMLLDDLQTLHGEVAKGDSVIRVVPLPSAIKVSGKSRAKNVQCAPALTLRVPQLKHEIVEEVSPVDVQIPEVSLKGDEYGAAFISGAIVIAGIVCATQFIAARTDDRECIDQDPLLAAGSLNPSARSCVVGRKVGLLEQFLDAWPQIDCLKTPRGATCRSDAVGANIRAHLFEHPVRYAYAAIHSHRGLTWCAIKMNEELPTVNPV